MSPVRLLEILRNEPLYGTVQAAGDGGSISTIGLGQQLGQDDILNGQIILKSVVEGDLDDD